MAISDAISWMQNILRKLEIILISSDIYPVMNCSYISVKFLLIFPAMA